MKRNSEATAAISVQRKTWLILFAKKQRLLEAAADTLMVFNPQSFRAFASPLSPAVFIDAKNGAQTFGQWLFYGAGKTLVGSAITVDTFE